MEKVANGSGSRVDEFAAGGENKEGDERTVQILLDHVVDRILGSYERWSDALRRSGKAFDAGDVLTSGRLREMLREVCGDTPGFVGGYRRSER